MFKQQTLNIFRKLGSTAGLLDHDGYNLLILNMEYYQLFTLPAQFSHAQVLKLHTLPILGQPSCC